MILKNAYRNYYTARLVNLTDLIEMAFKENGPEKEEVNEELDNIINADFLVIDELGKEPITKSGAEYKLLVKVLKKREKMALPFIISTNIDIDDIEEEYGKTIRSLISQSVQIPFTTLDMRSQVFKKKNALAKLRGGN
jgi:DNA replication protein DnaC